MKKIDIAMKREQANTRKDIIKGKCPQNYGLGLIYDDDTLECDKDNGIATGCRGIRCKEGWNAEHTPCDGEISIKDRLPEKHQTVNVKCTDGRYDNAFITALEDWSYGDWSYQVHTDITHWKEIND